MEIRTIGIDLGKTVRVDGHSPRSPACKNYQVYILQELSTVLGASPREARTMNYRDERVCLIPLFYAV